MLNNAHVAFDICARSFKWRLVDPVFLLILVSPIRIVENPVDAADAFAMGDGGGAILDESVTLDSPWENGDQKKGVPL